MDRMAANLQWLKARGIVVVYTPFVELDDRNKWHAKDGPKNGIRLFRLVHDYFTAKGLDNVIWAFHTTQRAGALKDYYPGDPYVDVIGKSAYGGGLPFNEYDWAVERKRQAGKVIWWAELGIRDKAEAPRDCLDVVKKLDEQYPELAGFNFWSDAGHYNVVGNRNAKELMTDPRIITLNSMDRLKAAARKAKQQTSGFRGGVPSPCQVRPTFLHIMVIAINTVPRIVTLSIWAAASMAMKNSLKSGSAQA
jgi:hypothetical protein